MARRGDGETFVIVAIVAPPIGVPVVIFAVRGRTPTLPSRRFRHNAFKNAARLLVVVLHYKVSFRKAKIPVFRTYLSIGKYPSQLIQQRGRTASRSVLPLHAAGNSPGRGYYSLFTRPEDIHHSSPASIACGNRPRTALVMSKNDECYTYTLTQTDGQTN